MATARAQTQEDWNARAYALASMRQLLGTATLVAGHTSNTRTYRVPSTDRTGTHLVVYNAATGAARCNCTAGEWSKPCGHAGAVLSAESQRAQAERTSWTDEAWRRWVNGGEWE